MKLEELNIDIESIKSISDELKSENIKKIHIKYCESIEQILIMVSSPLMFMTFAMAKVKENHISIKSAVKLGRFVNNPPKDPKIAAQELVNFFEKEINEANVTLIDDAKNESNNLYEKSEEIRNCLNNIGLNAMVNTWTLFESYSKDIWIKVFNENPNLLNQKIITSQNENGNYKSVPLNILSKYNFNVSKHLGEILSPKYDFTSTDGIKKAFVDLLSFN
jgi:hypothetical protein